MKAADIMTSPVITLRPSTPVPAAAALLVAHGFTAAPVVDRARHVLGIVTEADLIRHRILPEGWTFAEGVVPLVATVMTPVPVVMRPEDDVADVVSFMLDADVRSVPIVDDGVLVGIVSRRDVLRCVARGELTGAQVRARRVDVS